jgi:hypothetical protein
MRAAFNSSAIVFDMITLVILGYKTTNYEYLTNLSLNTNVL